VIARRPCALLKKAAYSGFYRVNEKCKTCKACMKLACPALSLSGETVAIDEALCNGCGLCPNVCKFGAIERG
jgi:indolepyruvate ferredoxin oxidoreductase alpha subunit